MRLNLFETLALAAFVAGCSARSEPAAVAQEAVRSIPLPPGYLAGYLPAGAAPNSLTLLPPPPAPGSAAQARDEAAKKKQKPKGDNA